MTTIITTAVCTLLLYWLVRLAIPELKRRARRQYRKHTRRFRTQTRKVYRREREPERGYNETLWSGVNVDEHRQHLRDSLRRAA